MYLQEADPSSSAATTHEAQSSSVLTPIEEEIIREDEAKKRKEEEKKTKAKVCKIDCSYWQYKERTVNQATCEVVFAFKGADAYTLGRVVAVTVAPE
jgi:hypothetical protein